MTEHVVGDAPAVGRDDQDGVVAGDGADDVGPVLVVDGDGDRVGVAGRGFQDEQVVGLADVGEEVGGQRGQAWAGALGRELAVSLGGLDQVPPSSEPARGATSPVLRGAEELAG